MLCVGLVLSQTLVSGKPIIFCVILRRIVRLRALRTFSQVEYEIVIQFTSFYAIMKS